MPLQASAPIKLYDGESEGVRPAPRWGGWGAAIRARRVLRRFSESRETPQIRVLPSRRESKLIKFLSFADTLLPVAIKRDPIFNKNYK